MGCAPRLYRFVPRDDVTGGSGEDVFHCHDDDRRSDDDSKRRVDDNTRGDADDSRRDVCRGTRNSPVIVSGNLQGEQISSLR